MKDYISVELGRTIINGEAIIVEFGRAVCNDDVLPEFKSNVQIELDTKLTEMGGVISSLYVRDRLVAICEPKFDEVNNSIIIKEIVDCESNTPQFSVGERIELDKNDDGLNDILNVTLNSVIVARGIILKGINNNVCYVMIK